jgi:DNA-directed RNA polymerase specialized sigma24 family protein
MAENNDIDIIEDEDNMDLASGADSYSFEDDGERAKFESMESTEDGEDELETTDKNELNPQKFGLKEEKASNIYCNNKELIAEIKRYQEEGVASEKLGELIIKIAVHMSTMVRFWRYTHDIKEELVQHAIYQMLLSVPKFNLNNEKGNAFGYLSMISYRDMLHSLKKWYKQHKIKDEISRVYLGRASRSEDSDKMGMLRHTLERSEEYNNFMKNDKYPYNDRVDTFALSKKEQQRRIKQSKKDGSDPFAKKSKKKKR